MPRSPRPSRRSTLLIAALAAVASVLVIAIAAFGQGADADDALTPARADASVTVLATGAGAPIAPGFVGVSFEYPALGAYAGTDPAAINPVLENLLRALTPGASPVIRIGGNSTDTTWWPAVGLRRPGGVTYSLSRRWLALIDRLASDVNGRLLLGVDLEALPAEVGQVEARELAARIPSTRLLALELSNEASRYATLPWYRDAAGRPVFARPRDYSFGSFSAEFAGMAHAVPHSAAIAGPTLAGDGWMAHLGGFLAAQRRLSLVTFHRYPLNRCFTPVGSPHYPTIAHLLSPSASQGLARAVAASVRVARRVHLPVRLDELNSVACGGKSGVSNTFAAALWALDTLFALDRAGTIGVNFHTFPRASYGLFRFLRRAGRWSLLTAAPEYYGMLAFAQAAPTGSRLLATRRAAPMTVRTWATRAPDGTLRVTLINDDLAHRHDVLVRLPVAAASATLIALRAPSVHSTSHVTLGGASVSSGGELGPLQRRPAIRRSAREYVVPLPRASAAILIVRPSSPRRG